MQSTTLAAILLPLALSLSWLYALRHAPLLPAPLRNRKITLLIAHPDDEAMFFSPTLLALSETGNTVSILCLSSGDSDGLGSIRKAELRESCRVLGVRGRVEVIEHSELPDSMSVRWPRGRIVEFLQLHAKDAEVVVTFDAGGVSGHPNHISLLDGAREFLGREVWTLATVGIVRKYLWVLDAALTVFSYRAGTAVVVSDISKMRTGQKAMTTAHKSQMRWFRWGWIGLSRYMVVNELVQDR